MLDKYYSKSTEKKRTAVDCVQPNIFIFTNQTLKRLTYKLTSSLFLEENTSLQRLQCLCPRVSTALTQSQSASPLYSFRNEESP